MIKNYIIVAWRNILKGQFYSLVNIIGLSVGIAFTLIIGAFVWSELQVNAHLKNLDRQYILQSKWKDPNMGNELVSLAPLAKALHDQYPGLVANYYRFDGVSSNVSKGDKHFRENFQIGDHTLLEMFGLDLLYGNSKSSLDDPFSVVVTEAAALKYFGKREVIGQTVSIENFSGTKHDFMISGVLKDHSKNSVTSLLDEKSSQFYLPVAAEDFFGRDIKTWQNPNIVSYIELQKGVQPNELEGPIRQLIRMNTPSATADNLVQYPVPLKDYYLNVNHGLVKKMNYVLSSIAFFILLMAVVNFVNMTISRSATRLKEIGIRKTLGGMKRHLIFQFLTESVTLVSVSTLFALFIYAAGRNYFSMMLGKELPLFSDFPRLFILFPLLFAMVVGTISGIYPAFVLSSIQSVDSLKGKLTSIKERIWLRKSLVGFQFAIAAVVFIGAIVISQQISYFFSNDLGYQKDLIISAQVPRDWSRSGVNRMEFIRGQLAAMPQVSQASLSFVVPDGRTSGSSMIYKSGTDSVSAISTQLLYTDEYFASTYGIHLKAGVFFCQPGVYTDSTTLVINETQAKALGWTQTQEAIGQRVRFSGSNQIFSVAGVTNDFHFGSMQQRVSPVTFMHVANANIFRYLSIQLKPGDIHATLVAIQKKWSALMPGAPFEYTFMDDTLKNLYKTELQLRRASFVATVLAFIIVLLGVLGLIGLSIQRRTKEIGIRKVLGSSVLNIIGLFVKEFLLIISIACLVACPIAYLIMRHWLNGYAYRIEITFLPFLISVFLLGTITTLLIGFQTSRVASSNPVKSLRTE